MASNAWLIHWTDAKGKDRVSPMLFGSAPGGMTAEAVQAHVEQFHETLFPGAQKIAIYEAEDEGIPSDVIRLAKKAAPQLKPKPVPPITIGVTAAGPAAESQTPQTGSTAAESPAEAAAAPGEPAPDAESAPDTEPLTVAK